MDTRGLLDRMTKKKMVFLSSSAALMVICSILLNKYLKGELKFTSLQLLFKLYKMHQVQTAKAQHILKTSQVEQKEIYKPIDYPHWQKALKDTTFPAIAVDLAAFDLNTDMLAAYIRENGDGKTVRIATKSLRVPELILRVLRRHPDVFKGVMCLSAKEAKLLQKLGIDDILIAYPTMQPSDLAILRTLHNKNTKISLVVDSVEQMQALDQTMEGVHNPFHVVIEVDMSLRLFNDLIHLGVHRSPIHSMDELRTLLQASRHFKNLKANGCMAYDAADAGLPDLDPHKPLLNPLASLVRNLVALNAKYLRDQIPAVFEEVGIKLEIFNGGGTGSVNRIVKQKNSTEVITSPDAKKNDLTEVTVGGGLLCAYQFSNYSNLQGPFAFKRAVFFILQVTRKPQDNVVTCLGGGYVASGDPGWNRVPKPYLPEGLKLITTQACGEAQTPLTGDKLPSIGGIVLFSPSKSGEIMEHFNECELVSENKIEHVKTYRGYGVCVL